MKMWSYQWCISEALSSADDLQTILNTLQSHLAGDKQRQAVETIIKLQELIESIQPLDKS